MREITKREKAFLSIGALVAVAIFVWLVLLPMLQGGGPRQKSSLEETQERLEAVQKLAGLRPMLVNLEESIGEQSGYKEISFKRGSANPTIINYIAQAAQQADIGELEQLDARPDTKRKTSTKVMSSQDVLEVIVDKMYMKQVHDEMEKDVSADNENAAEDKPKDEPPAEDIPAEVEGVKLDETDSSGGPAELEHGGRDNNSPEEKNSLSDRDEGDEVKDQIDSNASEEPEVAESAGDVEQIESIGTVFPPVPRGIPDEVGQLLVRSIEERQGKTLGLKDIEPFGVAAEAESDLNNETISGNLRQEFEYNGILLSDDTSISQGTDARWLISDGDKMYIVKKQGGQLSVCKRIYDVDKILDEAGLLDEEKSKIRRRLQLYSRAVDKKKFELAGYFDKLDISRTVTSVQQVDIFSIKMVFKGKINQLVKFMYNLQDSAKWLTIDSMRIGISDRKETTLSVELSMTATALYDI